jgi:tetratricopeptide (TPR) repeat protein
VNAIAPARALVIAPVIVLMIAFSGGVLSVEQASKLDAAALDAWWDFQRPDVSESRFRRELGSLPSGSPAALELQTQIARAEGLQRKFPAAHATLDRIENALPRVTPRVRVRYFLERGRVFNSSGAPEKAVPLFRDALALARKSGEDFLAIDAAHMLGIAVPPAGRLDWNLEALAMTEGTADARSKRWLASLYNNIGWTYHERGDYSTALLYFQKALPAWEQRGGSANIRAARWAIARCLRSLGRYDEAMAIQQALQDELQKSGEVDGYVLEELGELYLARGDAAAARPWFGRAHAVLSRDPGLLADEPTRLERLLRLAN